MKTFEIAQSKKELLKNAKTRTGIEKYILQAIIKATKISLKEFSTYINLGTRAIQLKKINEKLSQVPSEKALLIARVYAQGFMVFGNQEKFIRWMNSENYVLGNVKPKEYLTSYTGIELLLNEINAIDNSFVA